MIKRCYRKVKLPFRWHRRFLLELIYRHHFKIILTCIFIILISILYTLTIFKIQNASVENTNPQYNFFIDVLLDWQTLIAGLIAFAGAFLTVQRMKIESYKNRDDAYIHTKAHASIASSMLLNHLEILFNNLFLDHEKRDLSNKEATEALYQISNLLLYSDKNLQKHIYNICNFYQVLNARLDKTYNSAHSPNYGKIDDAMDIIYFAYLLLILIDYIRGKKEFDKNFDFNNPWLNKEKFVSAYINIVGLLNYDKTVYKKICNYLHSLSEVDLNKKYEWHTYKF